MRGKNAIFWSTFSKKGLKTPFLACFSKFCLRRRKIDQNRVFFLCFWRARKFTLVVLKQSRQNFRKFWRLLQERTLSSFTYDDGITLMKLNKQLYSDRIIPLCTSQLPHGTPVATFGLGSLSKAVFESSELPQSHLHSKLSSRHCRLTQRLSIRWLHRKVLFDFFTDTQVAEIENVHHYLQNEVYR